MVLLWPGPDTSTQSNPDLTEQNMPSIQRCFFLTLDYLHQTHPHFLKLKWTPPDKPLTRTAETRPLRHHVPHMTPPTGPSIQRPPPPSRTPRRPPRPSPPPPAVQFPPPQPPHPPPPPHPRPAYQPPSCEENPRKRAPKPVPAASAPSTAKAYAPAKPAPAARPKPKNAAKQPPKPVAAPGLGPLPNKSPSPTPAPGRGREPNPPRKSYRTCSPNHPRPSNSNAQHGAPTPSSTQPQQPSWRSAPRPRRDAPGPATTESSHLRPTDHPRPDLSNAKAKQQLLCPLASPRCPPTSSRCPATAAPTGPNRTPKRRPWARTHGSAYAHTPLPAHPHGTGLRGLARAHHRHHSP